MVEERRGGNEMLLQTQEPRHDEQPRAARERTGERIPRDRVPRGRRPATAPDEPAGATAPGERVGTTAGHCGAGDPRGAAARATRADRPGTTPAREHGAAAPAAR